MPLIDKERLFKYETINDVSQTLTVINTMLVMADRGKIYPAHEIHETIKYLIDVYGCSLYRHHLGDTIKQAIKKLEAVKTN